MNWNKDRMSFSQKLAYQQSQAYKQAQKEQFIKYLYTIPFVKERDLPFSFFEEIVKISSYEINDEEKIFFYFGFSTEEYYFLEECYKHLDSIDVNGYIFKNFDKVVNYFVNLIKFDVPLNYEQKKFSINNGLVSSIVEMYLCDPWDENDDGNLILIYEGYSKKEMYTSLSNYFDFIFKSYVPEGYSIFNKKLSEMTKKEKIILSTILY